MLTLAYSVALLPRRSAMNCAYSRGFLTQSDFKWKADRWFQVQRDNAIFMVARTAASHGIMVMNSYTLLYYPGFHPNTVWLHRVLLLADDVTRIVPTDVDLADPDDLLAMQDSIPGCLRAISPEGGDVAIENHDMPRLLKAFAFLAQSRHKLSKNHVEITISQTGSMSIAGHVFLHSAKVSPIIHEELRRNSLILDGFEALPGAEGF